MCPLYQPFQFVCGLPWKPDYRRDCALRWTLPGELAATQQTQPSCLAVRSMAGVAQALSRWGKRGGGRSTPGRVRCRQCRGNCPPAGGPWSDGRCRAVPCHSDSAQMFPVSVLCSLRLRGAGQDCWGTSPRVVAASRRVEHAAGCPCSRGQDEGWKRRQNLHSPEEDVELIQPGGGQERERGREPGR